jgi:glycerol uptake facilitator-like aquaporin
VVDIGLGHVFVTGMLVLLGAGVVANAVLATSKGFNGGWQVSSALQGGPTWRRDRQAAWA